MQGDEGCGGPGARGLVGVHEGGAAQLVLVQQLRQGLEPQQAQAWAQGWGVGPLGHLVGFGVLGVRVLGSGFSGFRAGSGGFPDGA